MDAIGKLIGFVILLTFTIDCVVSAARELLAAERIRRLRGSCPPPRVGEKLRTRARQQALLVALCGTLCLAAVYYTDLRVGTALNTGTMPRAFDALVTWIILFAGADRFRELLARLKGDSTGTVRKEIPAVRIAVDNDGQLRALPKAV